MTYLRLVHDENSGQDFVWMDTEKVSKATLSPAGDGMVKLTAGSNGRKDIVVVDRDQAGQIYRALMWAGFSDRKTGSSYVFKR